MDFNTTRHTIHNKIILSVFIFLFFCITISSHFYNTIMIAYTLTELGRTVVRTDGNQTISLYTVFEQPIHIHGNLESYDLIGPVYLRFLLQDAVFFNTTEVCLSVLE